MADAPWRCSQCGTANEPVANACRTCGRWPSLFDLERSTIESDRPDTHDDADEYAAQTVEIEQLEPQTYEVEREVELPPELEPAPMDEEDELPKPLWQRLGSLIVPIGVVLYIVITALANRGGG